jgi:hypothetical protein
VGCGKEKGRKSGCCATDICMIGSAKFSAPQISINDPEMMLFFFFIWNLLIVCSIPLCSSALLGPVVVRSPQGSVFLKHKSL